MQGSTLPLVISVQLAKTHLTLSVESWYCPGNTSDFHNFWGAPAPQFLMWNQLHNSSN